MIPALAHPLSIAPLQTLAASNSHHVQVSLNDYDNFGKAIAMNDAGDHLVVGANKKVLVLDAAPIKCFKHA